MIPRWERVRTGSSKWHVRFRAGNGEVVVHGENLTSQAACDTAIVAVAAGHSSYGYAHVDSDLLVLTQPGRANIAVPVVDVDERRAPLLKRILR
jgi:uncharacterized protein YegP (UPF0339 family)